MEMSGNTVLVTGGSSGIGEAIVRRLVDAGNEVLTCGRRAAKLQAIRARHPSVRTLACDLSRPDGRERLCQWVLSTAPNLNILINNAGIQRETDFRRGAPELFDGEGEIETNLTAAVHLAARFVPRFLGAGRPSAVVNVTSGLAFIPLRIVPVYCATKAALHSFSMSLRSQLADSDVRVIEIIPPIVDTPLHRGAAARRQGANGVSPDRVAEATLDALRRNRTEVAVGRAKDLRVASRIAPHFFHRLLNKVAADPEHGRSEERSEGRSERDVVVSSDRGKGEV